MTKYTLPQKGYYTANHKFGRPATHLKFPYASIHFLFNREREERGSNDTHKTQLTV